jgi:hypothetical protein
MQDISQGIARRVECECLLFNTNTAGISWQDNVNCQWDYKSQEEETSDIFFEKKLLDGELHFDPLYHEISKSHNNISPFSIKIIV